MHVLFIPKWYPGRRDPQIGDFFRKQALAVARKATVSVLHVTQEQEPGQHVEHHDGVWELHTSYAGSTTGNQLMRRARNYAGYRIAATLGWEKIVKERGMPDIVHAHVLARPAYLAWWIKRKFGLPFVLSEHSSVFLDGRYQQRSLAYKRWVEFLCSQAAMVTAVSPHLGAAMVQHGLVERYEMVPNIIPALERPLPRAGDRNRFLMVADLVDATKNISGAIKAFKQAKEVIPELRLDIIGGGPDRDPLEGLVEQLGLGEKVHFLGQMPNHAVLDHMASIGSVIVNSNFETFSIVTGEALALGKPVIATRCGGPETFLNDTNGVLINIGDDKALAAAILHVHRHHHLYVPAHLRSSVGDHCGSEAVGEKLIGLYQRVLANGRS